MNRARRRNNASANRNRAQFALQKRQLLLEGLEGRLLLAGDLVADYREFGHHNWAIATDVNGDYRTTPVDALQIINRLNQQGAGQLSSASSDELVRKFYDVNADNRIDPVDALHVINRLNSGEGEDPLVRLSLDATQNHVSLVDPATGQFSVSVGEVFDLELRYEDLRTPASNRFGAFTVYADITTMLPETFRPVVGETQRLTISANATGGTVTLSANGNTAGLDLGGIVTTRTIQLLFEQELGFGSGSVRVFEPGRDPSDPRQFFITFIGEQYVFQDVTNVVVDDSGVTPESASVTISEIPALIEDGPDANTEPDINPDALLFNIDRESFSFRDLETGNTVGERFYTNILSGRYTDGSLFDEVGGAGSNDNLIQFDDDLLPLFPFEVLSIPVQAIAPTTAANPAQFTVRLADESGHEITLYGRDDAVPADLVEIGNTGTISGVFSQQLAAINDAVTINEDSGATTINVLQNDSDAQGETITLSSIVTQPSRGTATVVGSSVRYTPTTNENGTDTFSYRIQNQSGDTATATVTVTITPVNDPPTVTNRTSSTNEDTAVTIPQATLLTGATPGPANESGQALSVTAAGGASSGSVVRNSDGSVTYTPAANFFGQATFTFTVSDGGATNNTATGTVTVTVNSLNDAPTLSNFSISATEDDTDTLSAAEIATLLAANGSAGPANENQTLSLVNPGSPISGSQGGQLTVLADGSVRYQPASNFFGAETFSITATDGVANVTATVTVNVQGVNDPPTATNDTLTVDENSIDAPLNVLSNDNAGPGGETGTLTITGVNQPPAAAGTVRIAGDGKSLLFTPTPNFLGTANFSYTVSDGSLTSTASVAVEVQPTIRPRARGDQFTIAEDSDATNFDVLDNDQPNEDASATLESVNLSNAAAGTISIDQNQTPDDRTDDTVRFTPARDFNGSVQFTYTISDTGPGVGDSDEARAAATGTVTVTVTPANDPPTANDDGVDPQVFAQEDTPLEIPGSELTANDSAGPANESGQTLTVTGVSPSSSRGGTVTVSGGNVTYTPPTDFTGTDSFTYTLSDGEGGTDTATVTVTVVEVNDRPTVGNDQVSTNEDVTLQINVANLLSNDSPVEGDQTLVVRSVATIPGVTSGSVSLNSATGIVTYTPAPNFFGTDTFTYTVDDAQPFNNTQTGTVTVTVSSVNDSPDAVDDVDNPATQTVEGIVSFRDVVRTIQASELLANDSPGPANESSQNLTITQISPAAGNRGTFSLNVAAQTITYTPPTGQSDFVDSFTYTISDGSLTDTAAAQVTVLPFEPSTFSGSINIQSGNLKLVGAQVQLSGESILGPIQRIAFVDADGGFTFGNVPPNVAGQNYQITIQPPAGIVGQAQSFQINVGPTGGVIKDDVNFSFGGLDPRRGALLDLLVSSFLLSNPQLANDPDLFNSGGVAGLDGDGDQQFFSIVAGFDAASFVEIDVNNNGTAVRLSYVEEGTARVLSALVPQDRFVLLQGQNHATVRIFGGLDDFSFAEVSVDAPDPSGFDDYLDGIEAYFDSLGG